MTKPRDQQIGILRSDSGFYNEDACAGAGFYLEVPRNAVEVGEAMSAAAAGLLRALLARAGVSRDRILLTEIRSVEWQSLTFVGERHVVALRLVGPDSGELLNLLTLGIEDAELSIPGHTVADIALIGPPSHEDDGAITLNLEALTIAE